MKKLFDIIGFDARRLRLQWVSAAEGQLFGEYITDFVELIKTLGSNPLRNLQSTCEELLSIEIRNVKPTDSKVVVTA